MEAETAKIMDQAVQSIANRKGKCLTFFLAGEKYGIGIREVKEIIRTMTVTPIPQTPQHIKGVINLHGKIIILDLRLKFEIYSIDYNERICIIVVEIVSGSNKIAMVIVVDSVSEVLNIKAAEI